MRLLDHPKQGLSSPDKSSFLVSSRAPRAPSLPQDLHLEWEANPIRLVSVLTPAQGCSRRVPCSTPLTPSPLSGPQVLAELKEYATEVDVDFVRKAVRAIGRCAIKVEVSL